MKTKIIPIASDHAGFEAKQKAKKILEELGYTPVDYGTHSADSVDYPDFAAEVSQLVDRGEHEQGMLFCGSGQGMCMTANKFKNIRAALAWNDEIAALAREHNNSNILCMPGRFLGEEEIKAIIEKWLNSEFEGGRHGQRVDKIHKATEN